MKERNTSKKREKEWQQRDNEINERVGRYALEKKKWLKRGEKTWDRNGGVEKAERHVLHETEPLSLNQVQIKTEGLQIN